MPKKNVDNGFVSIQAAAEQLEVTDQTIRRMIQDGRLNAYRIGKRRLRIRKEDLAAYIERTRVKVAAL